LALRCERYSQWQGASLGLSRGQHVAAAHRRVLHAAEFLHRFNRRRAVGRTLDITGLAWDSAPRLPAPKGGTRRNGPETLVALRPGGPDAARDRAELPANVD